MFLELENNSGKLQIVSGKFQNNTINNVKQISVSPVISNKNQKRICQTNINELFFNWDSLPARLNSH